MKMRVVSFIILSLLIFNMQSSDGFSITYRLVSEKDGTKISVDVHEDEIGYCLFNFPNIGGRLNGSSSSTTLGEVQEVAIEDFQELKAYINSRTRKDYNHPGYKAYFEASQYETSFSIFNSAYWRCIGIHWDSENNSYLVFELDQNLRDQDDAKGWYPAVEPHDIRCRSLELENHFWFSREEGHRQFLYIPTPDSFYNFLERFRNNQGYSNLPTPILLIMAGALLSPSEYVGVHMENGPLAVAWSMGKEYLHDYVFHILRLIRRLEEAHQKSRNYENDVNFLFRTFKSAWERRVNATWWTKWWANDEAVLIYLSALLDLFSAGSEFYSVLNISYREDATPFQVEGLRIRLLDSKFCNWLSRVHGIDQYPILAQLEREGFQFYFSFDELDSMNGESTGENDTMVSLQREERFWNPISHFQSFYYTPLLFFSAVFASDSRK